MKRWLADVTALLLSACAVLLCASCTKQDGVLVVTVEWVGTPADNITTLGVKVKRRSKPEVEEYDFPEKPRQMPLTFPTSFAFVLTSVKSDSLDLKVEAHEQGGKTVAVGEGVAEVSSGQEVKLTIKLSSSDCAKSPDGPGCGRDGGTTMTARDGGADAVAAVVADTNPVPPDAASADAASADAASADAASADAASADSAEADAAPVVSIPGLVGYWRFNEGAGMRVGDSSGGGNNGLVVGNAPWVEGPAGQKTALAFGDQRFVSVPNSASLNTITNEITIAAWVYRLPGRVDAFHPLVSRAVSNSIYEMYALAIPDGKPTFISNVPKKQTFSVEAPTALPTDKWTHVVFTTDGKTGRFFLNGNGGPTLSLSFMVGPDTSALLIGSNEDNGLPLAFVGAWIDELRLYNRTVTADEVAEMMYAP